MKKVTIIILTVFILLIVIFGFGICRFDFINGNISFTCTKEATEEVAQDSSSPSVSQTSNSLSGIEQVICPTDAKKCPEGYYVGRSGPNCEFVCEQ